MRCILATSLALCAAPALAQPEPATGTEIEAAISGNTLYSEIDDAGTSRDYFAEDGEMRGNDDVDSTWTIEDDALCMTFNAGSDCWQLAIDGNSVTWLRDGEAVGTAEIRTGNPEEF